MRRRGLIFAYLFFLALAALAVILFAPTALAAGGKINCDDWARTPVGPLPLLLENNVWGDEAADVCSFIGQDFFGWMWFKRFPSGNPIYPEVIYGKKPWLDKSTTSDLPKRVLSIRSIIVEADYETMALGRYNVLIDVWITEHEPSRPEHIRHEIGIFLEPHEMPRDCKTVEIGGYYYCYKAHKGKWTLHMFFLADDRKPETLDVMDFIEYAKISGTLYVASVELGNEVWFGNGITIVRKFNVTVIDP